MQIQCELAGRKSPLRAELIGADRCTLGGIITATAHAPVLALCRLLVDDGADPNRALEVFRGNTLVLRVRSIGAAALLHVEDSRHGTPTFRRRQTGPLGAVAAPAIAPIALLGADIRAAS